MALDSLDGFDLGGNGFHVTEIDEEVAKTIDAVPGDGVEDLWLEIGRDVVRTRFNDSDLHREYGHVIALMKSTASPG
jgi:hypothetical protein